MRLVWCWGGLAIVHQAVADERRFLSLPNVIIVVFRCDSVASNVASFFADFFFSRSLLSCGLTDSVRKKQVLATTIDGRGLGLCLAAWWSLTIPTYAIVVVIVIVPRSFSNPHHSMQCSMQCSIMFLSPAESRGLI